jgi:citrate synthase
VLSATGSGDYFKAIASALMTLGGLHGPLAATYDLLTAKDPLAEIDDKMERKYRIPGWGNSFEKDGVEEAFQPVDEALKKVNPELHTKIHQLTSYIQTKHGKLIWPNPSTYTAATAITIDMDKAIIGMMVVQARLVPWTQAFLAVVDDLPKI